MKNSLAVGITGILGSGKTTVLKIFKKMGFKTISCDEIVHRLLNKKDIIKKFIKILGSEVIKNNRIDRKKTREIIFNNPKKKRKIEKILHPEVFKKIKKEILDTKKKGGIIFIEIPLLFETKSEKLFDKIMVVTASRSEIKKRLKDKYSEEEIKNIWKSQLPLTFKKKKAHYVINNSGSIKETKKRVKNILKRLLMEIQH